MRLSPLLVVLTTALAAMGSPLAAVGVTVVDSADYVHPDPNGPNGEPDPAVWPTSGDLHAQAIPGVGLYISDPDNTASLLYHHPSAWPSSEGVEASVTALVRVPPVSNSSQAWTSNHIGFRLILDDGAHRTEVVMAREPGTGARELMLLNSGAAPIPFGWDNDQDNLYQLERLTDGRVRLTVTDGDPAAPNPTQSKTYLLGELPPSGGGPEFAWGMGAVGGGSAVFKEVHAQVSINEPPEVYSARYQAPIDADLVNVARLGRVIPVKAEIFVNDAEVKAGTVSLFVRQTTGDCTDATDAVEVYAAGSSSSGNEMTWDGAADLWRFNLDTSGAAGFAATCYRAEIYVGNATQNPSTGEVTGGTLAGTFNIKLKK
jgi:hypothetical protein